MSTLRLFSELKQFRENQGGSPQYTINMCFGEKFPDGKALEKKLIVVKVRTSFTFADAGRSPLPRQVTEPLLLFPLPSGRQVVPLICRHFHELAHMDGASSLHSANISLQMSHNSLYDLISSVFGLPSAEQEAAQLSTSFLSQA